MGYLGDIPPCFFHLFLSREFCQIFNNTQLVDDTVAHVLHLGSQPRVSCSCKQRAGQLLVLITTIHHSAKLHQPWWCASLPTPTPQGEP